MSKGTLRVTDNKLSARDLVTIGLLSLLLMAMVMVMMSVFFLIPVVYPFALAITAVPGGAVIILLLARVPKAGALFLSGLTLALMMLATGHHILTPIFLTAGALAAELLWKALGRRSFASMRLGYSTLMAGYALAAFIPYAFMRDSLIATAVDKGFDAQSMAAVTNLIRPSTLAVFAAISFGGAWLGAILGHRLLRKHFERAGKV